LTFEQAKQYLFDSWRIDNKKGHAKLLDALAFLGNPQERLKIIHVAGTNGKGSFCAMMASILTAEGHRVGCFTSPHLETFHERFRIGSTMISDDDFTRHMTRIADATRHVLGNDDGVSFSYFEIFVLLAFDYFCAAKVDYLVLEVGIGGRLDATNIIKKPLLSVIMSIGMDHMEILGDTVEAIAREKAGIIKENCPVVLYPNPHVVYNIIEDIAMAKNATVHPAAAVKISDVQSGLHGTEFAARHAYFGKIYIKLSMAGQYQLQNAACAIAAAIALDIESDAICKGLANVRWAGRMEVVDATPHRPLVVLEGAHNLQGAAAAAENMCNLLADRQITLLIGILKDKEHDEIVRTLAIHADSIVFTKPLYDHKATPPAELAAALGDCDAHSKRIHIIDNCLDALQHAIDITPKDGVIFCSGSLYLVGDVRKWLNEH